MPRVPMNELNHIAEGEPPAADDEDNAATKVTELPEDFFLEGGPLEIAPAHSRPPPAAGAATASSGVPRPAAGAPAPPRRAPLPPVPRAPLTARSVGVSTPSSKPIPSALASSPGVSRADESVQIRSVQAAAGEDVDVHGETRLTEVPTDPANAADAQRTPRAPQSNAALAANPYAATEYSNTPPGGARSVDAGGYTNTPPGRAPSFNAGGYTSTPASGAPSFNAGYTNTPPGGAPPIQASGGRVSFPGYPDASPSSSGPYSASSAYETNVANIHAKLPGFGAIVGPPAPVAVQARFAPPYAEAGTTPASGIVWAIGGILVGLVLLAVIAVVLLWLVRS